MSSHKRSVSLPHSHGKEEDGEKTSAGTFHPGKKTVVNSGVRLRKRIKRKRVSRPSNELLETAAETGINMPTLEPITEQHEPPRIISRDNKLISHSDVASAVNFYLILPVLYLGLRITLHITKSTPASYVFLWIGNVCSALLLLLGAVITDPMKNTPILDRQIIYSRLYPAVQLLWFLLLVLECVVIAQTIYWEPNNK